MLYYGLKFSVFCIFFNQIVNAYIDEVEKWCHLESNSILYLFYDTHNLPEAIRSEDKQLHYIHREQILHFLRSTNSSLVVEDPSCLIDEKTSFIDLYKKFNGERTSMYCIAPFVSKEGFLATSVEFRPSTIKNLSLITPSDVIEASKKQVKKIREYRDGDLLDKYYKKSCELHSYMLSRCERLFQLIADKNKGFSLIACEGVVCPDEVLDVLRKYYSDEFFKHFNACEKINMVVTCYNTHLLDAAILHALSEHLRRGEKSTIMYAGGNHLARITPILTKMGYRLHEHYVEPYGSKRLFDIKRALQAIEPSYDPNKPLPKTAVDYFLSYKRWEADHPTLKKFVPAYTMAVWYDYYQAWKQEKSVVKKAVPVAIAGTILAVVYVLVSLYLH